MYDYNQLFWPAFHAMKTALPVDNKESSKWKKMVPRSKYRTIHILKMKTLFASDIGLYRNTDYSRFDNGLSLSMLFSIDD